MCNGIPPHTRTSLLWYIRFCSGNLISALWWSYMISIVWEPKEIKYIYRLCLPFLPQGSQNSKVTAFPPLDSKILWDAFSDYVYISQQISWINKKSNPGYTHSHTKLQSRYTPYKFSFQLFSIYKDLLCFLLAVPWKINLLEMKNVHNSSLCQGL